MHDHAGNGLVEKTVDRLRQQAVVLLTSAHRKSGMDFAVDRPLFSWAFVHSAFLLNRFGVVHGQTPFEVASGRTYSGRLAEYGEPCLAYCNPGSQSKGNPKWIWSLWISKTALNEMHMVLTAAGVRLTRSVRRIPDAWKLKPQLCNIATGLPWQYEGVMGTGCSQVPRQFKANLLRACPVADEAASDPPSDQEEDKGGLVPEKSVSARADVDVSMSAGIEKRDAEKDPEEERVVMSRTE